MSDQNDSFQLSPDWMRGLTQPRVGRRGVLQFGAASVQLIEIKSGLQPGDKVIISDMSEYDGAAAIVLR